MSAPALPKGTFIGWRVGEPPTDEREHFFQCAACGGWVDMRDLGNVFDHEDGGTHAKPR